MSLRPSKALRNYLFESGSLKHALSNGCIKIYTGAQPSTAEAAPTGTLLCTVSSSSGALTREVLSAGSVDLTGGAAGSVDTLTVNSIEIMGSATAFNTSLAQTAQDVIDKINNNPKNHLFTAYLSATDVINIRAKPGMGTLPNGWVVASTVTTITKTDANMAGGVNPANGLQWGDAAAGVLTKLSSQTWSGVNAAAGTAGWFRIEASVADAGALDSDEAIIRLDGSISTSGADMNLSTTVFAAGATFTLSGGSLTLPTA
jgi:hypothetical protein